MASESLQLYLAGLYLQLYSKNKRGIHLAVAFNIFKSGFNILHTVGLPQPVISVRSFVVADGLLNFRNVASISKRGSSHTPCYSFALTKSQK